MALRKKEIERLTGLTLSEATEIRRDLREAGQSCFPTIDTGNPVLTYGITIYKKVEEA